MIARAPDPGDRRGTLIALTERGRELIDGVTGPHLANEARLLTPLTPAERDALAGLLRKLLIALPDQ
jgi:DNA-binding MarR family transcriptional regulator